MPVVKATYDGRVFVPSDPVEVPEGTQVEIVVPSSNSAKVPTSAQGKLTPEEQAEWDEIMRQIHSGDAPRPLGQMTPEQQATWEELKKYIHMTTEPPFRTVEEAISYTRKRR